MINFVQDTSFAQQSSWQISYLIQNENQHLPDLARIDMYHVNEQVMRVYDSSDKDYVIPQTIDKAFLKSNRPFR
jgi:hypothetical protein